ncbi:glutathione S-transferase-like isoform X2 [Orbicella faveolata]|uniref:glutathione S-transferase-like isoform X2 n=1 Tax=Orbicella faveolata TaxID=48498 RepID=UPI0009E2D4C8|nr:glutathione S-transferase-like isoform X2 [Orbicella faveolata]
MAERLSLQLAFALIALIAAVFYSGKAQFVFNKINQIIHGKRGCSPIVSIGHVTLHYFGFRGRAEGIRLMMEDFEIPYAETNFSKAEWPAVKEKGIETGLFTFGQVPAISTTTGLQLVQSKEDLRAKLSPVLYSPNFSSKLRNDHIESVVYTWLSFFEKLAPVEDNSTNVNGLFFASERLTWVDYVMFDLLDTHVEFSRLSFGDDAPTVDVLANYPKLKAFYETFSSRPKIARYLKAERRVPFRLG